MKIAGATLNQTPIDWENNKNNIIDAIKIARNNNVDLLCLPELCIPSYGCQDLFLAPWVCQKSLDILTELIPHTKDISVSIGLPICFENEIFNCAAFVQNGELKGFYAKQILANDGVHYEARWFNSWPTGLISELEVNGDKYPIGEIIFDCKNQKIGFEICEDAWHEDRRPANNYKNVDVILNPSASHFAFGKAEFREKLITDSSKKFDCTYVYVNLLGNESGKMIYDGDVLVARKGKLLVKSDRLGFKKFDVVINDETEIQLSSLDRFEEFIRLNH